MDVIQKINFIFYQRHFDFMTPKMKNLFLIWSLFLKFEKVVFKASCKIENKLFLGSLLGENFFNE